MFTSWCPSASVQRLNTELLRGEGFSLLRFRRFQPPRLMAPKSLGEPQGATGGINFFPARWNFGEAVSHHPQVPGFGVPSRGYPDRHAALHAAAAKPDLYGDHAGEEASRADRAEEGIGHRGAK